MGEGGREGKWERVVGRVVGSKGELGRVVGRKGEWGRVVGEEG